MLKRYYYIANSYDGAYFVLTDDVQEYVQRMASYVINLEGSKKTNHYSFGSVEMSALEYDRFRAEATRLESSLTDQKKQEKNIAASEIIPSTTDNEDQDSDTDLSSTSHENNPQDPKPRKGHLRLV